MEGREGREVQNQIDASVKLMVEDYDDVRQAYDVRPHRTLIFTSLGAGWPLPFSNKSLRLNIKIAHFVEQ